MATHAGRRPQPTDWLQQTLADWATKGNHRDLDVTTDTGQVHIAIRGRSASWTLRVADAIGTYAQLQARITHLHGTYQQEQRNGGAQRRLDIVWSVPADALGVIGTLRLDDVTPTDEVLLAGADVLDGEAERSWPLLHGDDDHRFVPAWDDRIHAIGVHLRAAIAPLLDRPQVADTRRIPDDLLVHALRDACILEPSERRAILFAHLDQAIPDPRHLIALLHADAEVHRLIQLSGRTGDADRISDLATRRRSEWYAIRHPRSSSPAPTRPSSLPNEPDDAEAEAEFLGWCQHGDVHDGDAETESDHPMAPPPPGDAAVPPGDAPSAPTPTAAATAATDTTVEPAPASPQPTVTPSPQTYTDRLREHVIGQDEATRLLGLAAYRFAHASHRGALLLVGPSGCGKTLVATELARVLDRPVVHANAAALVPTGIVGTCITNVLIRLWEAAGQSIAKAEHGVLVFDEIDKLLVGSHYGPSILSQLLRLVEGSDVAIDDEKMAPRLKSLNTKGMLIVLAGAWTQRHADGHAQRIGFAINGTSQTDSDEKTLSAEDLGFAPEMAGRISAVVPIRQHTRESLLAILRHPTASPFAALRSHLAERGGALEVSETCLMTMANQALAAGTGARALVRIADRLCEPVWMRCGSETDARYVLGEHGLMSS